MAVILLAFLAIVLGAVTGAYYSIPLLILTVAVVAGLVFAIHAKRCELAARGVLPKAWAAGCEQDYIDLDASADAEVAREQAERG